MTDKFLLELENFLNEKFDGEWDMSWQVEERAIDIRLILNQDKEVINFRRVNNVIQFPKSIEKDKRLKMKQARVEEIQRENDWLSADIEHFQKTLEGNINELQDLLKELAELYNLELPHELTDEFSFEFDPDEE